MYFSLTRVDDLLYTKAPGRRGRLCKDRSVLWGAAMAISRPAISHLLFRFTIEDIGAWASLITKRTSMLCAE